MRLHRHQTHQCGHQHQHIYTYEHEHQHEHQQHNCQTHTHTHKKSSSISQKQQIIHTNNITYLIIAILIVILSIITIYTIFTKQQQYKKDGRFYNQYIMNLQLIQQWKLTQSQMMQQQSQTNKNIIQQNQHKISRQEMGRQSWSLLHMMTGAFPQQFDDVLRQKFNTFLVLFGQMYPCKLCANHFMELVRKEGLFKGNSKRQLMEYLCYMHNKVNERLGHPIHDCSNVVEQWNTCGCSGQPIS